MRSPELGALAQVQIGLDEGADLQDADDVVDRALVDGQAAVVLIAHLLEDLRERIVDVDGRDVHTRGEDALDRDVAELQRRGDQLALLFVKAAFLGHVLDDIVQLVLGDRDLRVALGELRRAAADRRQQRRERREKLHQHAHRARAGEQQLFAVLLAQALRQHLAEEKHDDRGDDRAEGDEAQSPAPRDRHGHDRGDGDMYDVRTDQDRGDRAVEVIEQEQRVLRPRIAAFGRRFDLRARRGGHGRLGDGEIHGAE